MWSMRGYFVPFMVRKVVAIIINFSRYSTRRRSSLTLLTTYNGISFCKFFSGMGYHFVGNKIYTHRNCTDQFVSQRFQIMSCILMGLNNYGNVTWMNSSCRKKGNFAKLRYPKALYLPVILVLCPLPVKTFLFHWNPHDIFFTKKVKHQRSHFSAFRCAPLVS